LVAFNIIYTFPITANAGFFSFVANLFSSGSPITSEVQNPDLNSQNLPVLQSSVNFDSNAAVGGGDINTVDDEALISESGPSGTLADIADTVNTGQISKYTVRKGDSLGSIAKMYEVTTNTIIWANDLTSLNVKEGQSLIILPISGTLHTVIKGDTLKSIAKKYKADAGEISQFNNLDSGSSLAIGEIIIIPDGEGAVKVSGTKPKVRGNPFRGGSGPNYVGYYIRPIIGGVKTQGLHGYNAVDLGTPVGTVVYAAAAGKVMFAKTSGWNTGYGKYIVISHPNDTQTVYAHLSEVLVSEGQTVFQGEVIGLTGNTGKSTGPHLHFEIRGAVNPF
jgi:LysM repeat protein